MTEYSLPVSIDASLRVAAPYDMFPSTMGDEEFGDEPPFCEHVYAAMEAHIQARAERELDPFERAMCAYDRELSDPLNAALREVYGL